MKTILIVCAATMLLSVSFSVQADPPDPTPGATKLVREQNLDENGSIAVHEQGVVSVANEDGGELDVNVTGGSIDANISGGSVDANVTNTVTVTGSVEVANFPSTQTVDGTVNVGNFPASQSTKGREYIGSTSLTLPDIGIMAMHAMCDAEFEGSRMCRSSDILRNGGDMASPPRRLACMGSTRPRRWCYSRKTRKLFPWRLFRSRRVWRLHVGLQCSSCTIVPRLVLVVRQRDWLSARAEWHVRSTRVQ